VTVAKSVDFILNQLRNGSTGSLAAGTITFYAAGTTTPKAVWTDRDMTAPSVAGILTPYTLSADGTAKLFAYGVYRVIIKSSTGVTIYDYDNLEFYPVSTATVSDGATTVVLDAVAGDVNLTFTTGTSLVRAIRTDATANAAVLTLPGGYTIAGSGASSIALTSQGETVTIYLNDSEYYVL